jgi:hypothetical protein
MKQKILITVLLLSSLTLFTLSCQKESSLKQQPQEEFATTIGTANNPTFNLEVILRGEDGRLGHVKFRQDVDPSKIITLDTWVRDLEPNHQYLLQRAVDAANVVDGDCTSTSWLTLGRGLTPQSILTDDNGTGSEELWRDVSMVASGTAFDIHFRIVDASTMAVVLTSDCYQYTVR